jgi:MFS family permease
MVSSENSKPINPHQIRSLIAVIVGSLLLRAAAGAMGENIQFYFNAIHEASLNPAHPLRQVVGDGQVYAITYTLGGLIIATFFAAELIGSVFFGAWSDRYGRKLFIIFGPLFGAIAVQITAMTTVIWLLVFTRLLEGLSTASNAPSTLGYIAELTSGSAKLRSRVVGLYEIATIGGAGLGFSLGGWLWHHYGGPARIAGVQFTSLAFALDALIYLASLAILWLGVNEMRGPIANNPAPASGVKDTLKHYWAIASSPAVANFAPAWISINAVLGIWLNLTARILTDKQGFSGQLLVGNFTSMQAGNILTAYAGVFVVGILIWSFIPPVFRKTSTMLIGIGGLFASGLFMALLNHQPSLSGPMIPVIVVFLALSILVQSGFTPAALAYLADITEHHSADRGAVMGLYSVFLGLGQFIGLSVGGPFVDWRGADGMVIVTSLLGLVAGFFIIQLHLRNKAQELAAGKA